MSRLFPHRFRQPLVGAALAVFLSLLYPLPSRAATQPAPVVPELEVLIERLQQHDRLESSDAMSTSADSLNERLVRAALASFDALDPKAVALLQSCGLGISLRQADFERLR